MTTAQIRARTGQPALVCVSCSAKIAPEQIPLCPTCRPIVAVHGYTRPARSHTKTTAEWRAIVDSHYARRDADGLVAQPNWSVRPTNTDSAGEWNGQWYGDGFLDICPALPEEIQPPVAGIKRQWQNTPVNSAAVGKRLGYDHNAYAFVLDRSGAATAEFIRATRTQKDPAR